MNIATKITTLTSREFNQDLARAKRAARQGPVMVTDRGMPSFVLLSYDEFERLNGISPSNPPHRKMSEMLAMKDGDDIEFDIPRFDEMARAADLE